MSLIPPTWQERRVVGWLDVDVRGRLRPHALFGYLLDAASNQAQGTLLGYAELAARNLKWVMIKMQLVIHCQPRWGDEVTVETWGKRMDRLYALRDYAVVSASGEKLVSGTSAWLIVDRNTFRPQRFDARADTLPWQPARDELVTSVEKVPEATDGVLAATFRAQFSDIDVNRHVNATRYLQWIVDAHPYEHLEACELAAVDLSFIAEALPGDEVAIFVAAGPDGELAAIRRTSDGKELCRARLTWRDSTSLLE